MVKGSRGKGRVEQMVVEGSSNSPAKSSSKKKKSSSSGDYKTRKDTIDFRHPLFRLFRTVDTNHEFRVSKHSIAVINSILLDLLHRIGEEAGRLCKYTRRDIMKARDVQTALRLVITTHDLCRYAIQEGEVKMKSWADIKQAKDNEVEMN